MSAVYILLLTVSLFVLSICFTVVMDLLLQLSPSVILKNILQPFRFMFRDEMVILSLIVVYVFGKPVALRLLKKK